MLGWCATAETCRRSVGAKALVAVLVSTVIISTLVGCGRRSEALRNAGFAVRVTTTVQLDERLGVPVYRVTGRVENLQAESIEGLWLVGRTDHATLRPDAAKPTIYDVGTLAPGTVGEFSGEWMLAPPNAPDSPKLTSLRAFKGEKPKFAWRLSDAEFESALAERAEVLRTCWPGDPRRQDSCW